MHDVLLVEDEPAALQRLESLLNDYSELKVQARAFSLEQAIAAVRAAKPDLVFLDLMLGGTHGSALLPWLPADCRVVITTAYNDFAIAAYEAGVCDYLLKPIRRERLALCLQRLLGAANLAEPKAPAANTADGFWLDNSGCRDFVRLDHVLWVVAMRRQTHLQLVDRDPMVLNRSISEWDGLLPPNQFQRLDRSTIIHLPALRTVKRVSRSLTQLFFYGFEEPLSVGATAAKRLKELLTVR